MKKLSLFLLSSLFLAACQQAAEPSVDDDIAIGYIGPLTGDAAAYGIDTLNGVLLAAQEINDAGGIDGRMIRIISEDARCTGTDAASAAQKLVNVDSVVAIIGGQCSGETLAAAPIADAAEVVMISPLSSSPDVTDAGDFIFRDYPSDALKTVAMGRHFEDEGIATVAVITENTDFAVAFRDALRETLGDDALVLDEVVEPGTKDFRTLLTRLQDAEFDIFFPNGQAPATIAAMMQQFREQGFTQPAISHDVADSLDLISIAGEAVEGLRVINVPSAGEGGSFETAFTAAYGTPQQALAFAAHAYDAMNVLAQVMEDVGTNGTAIRDALYALPEYDGVVGSFRFDENGDVVGIPYVLKEVQDGAFVTLRDIDVD